MCLYNVTDLIQKIEVCSLTHMYFGAQIRIDIVLGSDEELASLLQFITTLAFLAMSLYKTYIFILIINKYGNDSKDSI